MGTEISKRQTIKRLPTITRISAPIHRSDPVIRNQKSEVKMQTRIATQHPFAAAITAALLLGALFGTPAAYAQQATINAKSTPAAAATGAKSSVLKDTAAKQEENTVQRMKQGEPEGEGVEVHGHWVIDVRNPNGKLIEHREFENALVTRPGGLLSGDQLLAGLLSGNQTAGDPGIGLLQGTPGADLTEACNTAVPLNGGTVAPNSTCFGVTTTQSGMALYLANFSTGLTSTVTFSPSVSWILSGNYTVPSTLTSISGAQTLVSTCFTNSLLGVFLGSTSSTRLADFSGSRCIEATTNPVAPSYAGGGAPPVGDYLNFVTLTSASLSTPLAVSAGQIITVTATITFS
jgi:hypothetical protein